MIRDGTIGPPESNWVLGVVLSQPEVDVKSNITRQWVIAVVRVCMYCCCTVQTRTVPKRNIKQPRTFRTNRGHWIQDAQLLLGQTALFVTFKWPLKVAQDQRSWRTFTKWAMVNIYVNRHHGPRSNREVATLDFHFCDLRMTPSRSSGVKVCMDS